MPTNDLANIGFGAPCIVKCFGFIRYTDKYNLGDATQAVYTTLKKTLKEALGHYTHSKKSHVAGEEIELVFCVTSPGHPLRSLIVQGAICQYGPAKMNTLRKQEEQVDGYAAELLLQLRGCDRANHSEWYDAIREETRKQ